jgi:hypothetical protein
MADDFQATLQKVADAMNQGAPSHKTQQVPDYGLGEPANTQEWIRRTWGEPTHKLRRMKPEHRKALVGQYGEGNPELEDLFKKAPSMTEQDVMQYLSDKNTGMSWEDWAAKFNAGY